MTILVTGGAGFIGANFILYMMKAHKELRILCLDKLTYAADLSYLTPVAGSPRFRFVKGDICDRDAVYRLFEEEHPDVVVNFAAESHVDRSIEDPALFLKTNILGTGVLLDGCRTCGIRRFHQVSTDEVYGDLPLDRPDLLFTEESPLDPHSPTAAPRPAPTSSPSLTAGPTASPSPSPGAAITTAPSSTPKSSSPSPSKGPSRTAPSPSTATEKTCGTGST